MTSPKDPLDVALDAAVENLNHFIRVGGKSFHCERCGSNVFSAAKPRDGLRRFSCNGCDAYYAGM